MDARLRGREKMGLLGKMRPRKRSSGRLCANRGDQATGTVSTNVAPDLEVGSSRRRSAFMFLARRCERARPNPRPGALLAASWTLLEKGLKRRARLVGSRPG